MIRLLITGMLLLNSLSLLCQSAHADSTFPHQETSSSLLWEVSRDGITSKSYIFGTNHLLSSSYIDTSVVINGIINSVDAVAMEVEDKSVDTAALIRSMTMEQDKYYNFPVAGDENILKDYIRSKPGFEKFADLYSRLKPIALWLILFYGEGILQQSNSGSTFISLDDYFDKESIRLGKERFGFETITEQTTIFFNSIPLNDQVKILMQTVKAGDEALAKSNAVMDSCYKSQDINCLSSFGIFGTANKKFNDIFLLHRNIKWMPEIIRLISQQSTVIAVGAGHLPGEYGLINLLIKEGFTLKPLKF